MTPFSIGTALVGAALLAAGLAADWVSLVVIGGGLVVLVAAAGAYVARRPQVAIERAVQPPRVEKGLPAIAVVHATNLSRRTLAPSPSSSASGIPRSTPSSPGSAGVSGASAPTGCRPAPAGYTRSGRWRSTGRTPLVCHSVQRLGSPQRIAVHPRLLPLRPLSTGASANLEGPSSDTSPQGTVTFHRLREYVVGDDLRTVHWPSTARLGKLVVRHNVDTAQPYTVVLTDLRPERYSAETFEEAVDVTASVLTSLASDRAPVQLRLTSGERLGVPASARPTPWWTDTRRWRPSPLAPSPPNSTYCAGNGAAPPSS